MRTVGIAVMWGSAILGTADLISGNHAEGITFIALAVADAAHLRMNRSENQPRICGRCKRNALAGERFCPYHLPAKYTQT